MPASLSNKELHILINIVEDRFKSGLMPKDVETLYKRMVRATKKITVQSAKSKGRDFQHFICSRIAGLLGIDYVQSDDTCPIHSREMGQNGTDVVFRTKEVQFQFPFSIECKSGKSLELNSSIEQAKNNKLENTDWLVTYRGDRQDPIVILDWMAFERLLQRILK